jgi:hypothetical protein
MRDMFLQKLIFIGAFFCFTIQVGLCQNNTVGVLHKTDSVSEGYTLFTPDQNTDAYLINNCGEIINQWNFTERPAQTCYLLENGNLLRVGRSYIEIRDWNDNLVWKVLKNSLNVRQHHDIEHLPNGNILLLLKDNYTDSVIIQNGRDSSKVAANFFLDRIIEIQPIGTDSAIIVWDWTYFDHLIQDFDSSKANYGNVLNHPELLDLNYENNQLVDYTHCNSIDYNPYLDQILLSARHLNEIMIIDHSTTTAQASGHSGGVSGKGGDFIWRWGNPAVYKRGTILDQKLFLQHDAKWIDSGYADGGKISVFNNSIDTNYNQSSVNVLIPSILGINYTKTVNIYDPISFDFSWSDSILGNVFYEKNKSGVQSTKDGNLLICETSKGQITEISKSGKNVWTYKNPVGISIFNQFDSVTFNGIFRATKYPTSYPAFIGKTLSKSGTIENINTMTDSCYIYIDINELERITPYVLNPAYNGQIRFSSNLSNTSMSISDLSGKKVISVSSFNGNVLESNLKPGVYVIELIFGDASRIAQKVIVQ